MREVHITVDGITYTLRETVTGDWSVTNRAPYIAGEYPVTVTVTTEAGQKITMDIDDPKLTEALLLIVVEGDTISGNRMLDYWPQAIKQILEFQAIINAEGFEIDFLSDYVDVSINEAYLLTMGENRISEWEKVLSISPDVTDTLDDRRDVIVARIRGQGKLNTALINAIVSAFTGGTATSYVKNSVLYVQITPPPDNKQYKFDSVVRELSKKIPAHLGLSVTRDYSTWGEVKDNYANWNAVKQLTTWNDLVLWISPQ